MRGCTNAGSKSLRLYIFAAITLVCLQIWMDTCLYCQIQLIKEDIDDGHWDPGTKSSKYKYQVLQDDDKFSEPAPSEYLVANNNSISWKMHIINKFAFAFRGMSIKLMMTDPIDNYLFAPLSAAFARRVDFKNHLHFITANIVSYAGVVSAIIAGVLVSTECYTMHILSFIMFQLRTWLDDLDGDVARSRMGILKHISMYKTPGYIVDGICDAIGFVAYIIGCYVHLRKVAKWKHRAEIMVGYRSQPEIVVTSNLPDHSGKDCTNTINQKYSSNAIEDEHYDSEDTSDDNEDAPIFAPHNDGQGSCRTIRRERILPNNVRYDNYREKNFIHRSLSNVAHLGECFKGIYCYLRSKVHIGLNHHKIALHIICFLLQIALCAFFWNRYILIYQDLLESKSANALQARLKKNILKSNIMFAVIWFWRLTNGHSLVQMLITAVLFKKLWPFLNFIKYVGFVEIIFLAMITELHIIDARNLLKEVD